MSPHRGKNPDVVNRRQGVGNEANGHCQANEESLSFLHMAYLPFIASLWASNPTQVPQGRSFGTRP